MKHSVVLVLLITSVSCQPSQTRTREVHADLGYISSSATKVTKRDAGSIFILASWKGALQKKCLYSQLSNNTEILEVANTNFQNCKNEVENPMPDAPGSNTNSTVFTNSLCRFLTEANSCFLKFTDELKPCLPPFRGGNFPFSSVSQAVINYMCAEDDETKERSKLFWENVNTCVAEAERTKKCEGGKPYHKLEDTTYMYSQESCGQLTGYWKCVKAELHECPTLVFDFLEGLAKAVDPIYTPCPVDRTS